MNKTEIERKARELGFAACGTARLHSVDAETMRAYDEWIAAGRHASMAYMENHRELRENPQLLMPGARSIVVVALSYAPKQRLPEGEPQIADYALGKDYHDLMRQKLNSLAQACGFGRFRACVDTAPILERYWAVEAGLGWIGRNQQLIIPRAGSQFFLGEILVEETLPESPRQKNRCGNCTRCIEACPTGALSQAVPSISPATVPSDSIAWPPSLDARRCLSFQTIENRGEIPPELAAKMGDTFYGCDRCQRVCPWNRFSVPTAEPALQPSPALLAMKKADWQSLTQEQYQRLFKGSAVKRAKFEGIIRNIKHVILR